VTGERVACVVSGGNVDLTEHAELTRTGLLELDRYVEARLHVADWPTALGRVGDAVADAGAGLDAVERADRTAGDPPNRTPVAVGIEGNGADHLREVLGSLAELDGVAVASHTLA